MRDRKEARLQKQQAKAQASKVLEEGLKRKNFTSFTTIWKVI